MRPIKFRGKGKKDGKWYFGNLFDKDIYGRTHIYTINVGCLNIDPNTVGQFTGLYDKNGKEIYEGDILRFGNFPSVVCEVKWNERITAFCIRFYFERNLGSRTLGEWVICERSVEIIGNIHDNPELLKGGLE